MPVLSLSKWPANNLIAGTKNFCPGTRMARSYKLFTQKVGCIEGARINHHAGFHKNAVGNCGFSDSFVALPFH
jgi:hypothetical protein